MRITLQILLSFAVLFIFSAAVYLAKDWPQQARLFPWAIAVPMLVLALIQLVHDFRGSDRAAAKEPLSDREATAVARRRMFGIFSWIVGFLFAIWLAGFHIAVPVIVFFYLKVQSREPWGVSLLCTAIAWLFVWGLFDRFLNLPFPEGVVIEWIEGVSS